MIAIDWRMWHFDYSSGKKNAFFKIHIVLQSLINMKYMIVILISQGTTTFCVCFFSDMYQLILVLLARLRTLLCSVFCNTTTTTDCDAEVVFLVLRNGWRTYALVNSTLDKVIEINRSRHIGKCSAKGRVNIVLVEGSLSLQI